MMKTSLLHSKYVTCLPTRLFHFFLSFPEVIVQIEFIIGVQWGQENPYPSAHHSSEKQGLPSFPMNGGPNGWDFPVTTEQQ